MQPQIATQIHWGQRTARYESRPQPVLHAAFVISLWFIEKTTKLKAASFCRNTFQLRSPVSQQSTFYESMLQMPYLYYHASIENHSLVEYTLLQINTVALKVRGCFKINLDSCAEESFYEMKRDTVFKQQNCLLNHSSMELHCFSQIILGRAKMHFWYKARSC